MKRRHKTILICCTSYALAFSLSALLFPLPESVPETAAPQSVFSPGESYSFENAAAAESAEPAPSQAGDIWLLTEEEGSIRVMHGSQCVFVTGINPDTLRSADRKLLKQGVVADSMEEILMLIEDLGS